MLRLEYILEHILQLPCSEVFNADNLQGICVQLLTLENILKHVLQLPCSEMFNVNNLQGPYVYSCSDWGVCMSIYCSCLADRSFVNSCSVWNICMSTYCSCLAGRSCMYSIWTYVCEVGNRFHALS